MLTIAQFRWFFQCFDELKRNLAAKVVFFVCQLSERKKENRFTYYLEQITNHEVFKRS